MSSHTTRAEGSAGGEQDAGGRAREGDEALGAWVERRDDPGRVLALSDGVFAIIITLLVLDVHVPELTAGQSLAEALQEIRSSLTAFVISFIVAGMFWVGHRDQFGLIRRTDRGLVWMNILYLLPLSLLPFGASLLGRYDQDPVALRIYGGVLVAIAVMRLAMWLYVASRPHLLWRRLGDRERRAGLALTVAGGLTYLFGFLIAEVAPVVSLVIFGGMPVLYFVTITVLRRGRKGNQEYGDFT